MSVKTGIDVLYADVNLQKQYAGNIALLCHNASINDSCIPSSLLFKKMFGSRFTKLFGPQHGFSTDLQDNMIESDHAFQPYFKIPVYSLYSETRIPSDEMLEGIDHLFIDLQDIGCRMYTYIYTLCLILEKCAGKNLEIIILDRPNPINGIDVEGNLLDVDFASFIGLYSLPVRHGLTIAEVGLMHQKYWAKSHCNLKVIKMQGWKRDMYFEDTALPWALPSPNIARPDAAFTFPGTVLFEGTNLSEGRGTTQPLEIVGHPAIEPYTLSEHLQEVYLKTDLTGFQIRPINFFPTFHKFKDEPCGGFQIHITNRKTFQPWKVGQVLMRELYNCLGKNFEWRKAPYEYDYINEPIDIINGTDHFRKWVEANGSYEDLKYLEDYSSFLPLKKDIEIYK